MSVRYTALTLVGILVAVIGHDILSWLALYSISGKALDTAMYMIIIHGSRLLYFVLVGFIAYSLRQAHAKYLLGLYVVVEAVKYSSLTRVYSEGHSVLEVNAVNLFYLVLVVGVILGVFIGSAYKNYRRDIG